MIGQRLAVDVERQLRAVGDRERAERERLGVYEGSLGFAPQRQRALNRYKLLTGEH